MHNHIRELRRRASGSGPGGRMTQQELGDAAGLTRQTLNRLEQGIYDNPSAEAALKIARHLGVPMEEVFHLDECPAEVAADA